MGLVNVSEIMADPDFVSAFSIKRPRADFDAAGVFGVLDYETITAIGVVQPASPETIQMLPEGERSTEIIEVWSATPMVKSNASDTLSDVIVYGGRSYRVSKLENWTAHGYSYAVAEAFLPPTVPA